MKHLLVLLAGLLGGCVDGLAPAEVGIGRVIGPYPGRLAAVLPPITRIKAPATSGAVSMLSPHIARPPTAIDRKISVNRPCKSPCVKEASHVEVASMPAPNADHKAPTSKAPALKFCSANTGNMKAKALAARLKSAAATISTRTVCCT